MRQGAFPAKIKMEETKFCSHLDISFIRSLSSGKANFGASRTNTPEVLPG